MKMNALKPLGEEKPAVINDTDTNTDTKIRDTLVDVPLPDSEAETESKTKTTKTKTKTKTTTKTKTDQPSANSVQNTQDHNHCRADSIKDGQFASTQAMSPALGYHEYLPKPPRYPTRGLIPHALYSPLWLCARTSLYIAYTHAISPIVTLR